MKIRIAYFPEEAENAEKLSNLVSMAYEARSKHSERDGIHHIYIETKPHRTPHNAPKRKDKKR